MDELTVNMSAVTILPNSTITGRINATVTGGIAYSAVYTVDNSTFEVPAINLYGVTDDGFPFVLAESGIGGPNGVFTSLVSIFSLSSHREALISLHLTGYRALIWQGRTGTCRRTSFWRAWWRWEGPYGWMRTLSDRLGAVLANSEIVVLVILWCRKATK
jgi:hypothetical protein